MNNVLGTNGYAPSTEEYIYQQLPTYTRVFNGSESDVRYSGSIYRARGWNVKLEEGSPWKMTATIQSELNGSGSEDITPIESTGSFITVNWSLHYNTFEKNLLEVDNNGISSGSISWIRDIDTADKFTLNDLLNNKPQSGSVAHSMNLVDAGINWSNYTSSSYSGDLPPFYHSNPTSLFASQVAFTLLNNGVKTVPVIQQVIRQTLTVPSSSVLTYYNNNINRVYSKSSMQAETGVPANWYAVMKQDADPSDVELVGSGGSGLTGSNLSLIYGWLKQPPSQDQNGATITIQQDWVYGLWFTALYGSRI
jgi:hypothetical protein